MKSWEYAFYFSYDRDLSSCYTPAANKITDLQILKELLYLAFPLAQHWVFIIKNHNIS